MYTIKSKCAYAFTTELVKTIVRDVGTYAYYLYIFSYNKLCMNKSLQPLDHLYKLYYSVTHTFYL